MFRTGAAVTLSLLVLSAAGLFGDNQRGLAQSQNESVPNLTGTWELIELKDAMKLKATDARFPKLMLVITQEGSQLRITQKRTVRGTVRATECPSTRTAAAKQTLDGSNPFPTRPKLSP